jgi:restriction system protein
VFITSSDFTREAREYVKTIGHTVILIDGEMLGDLMIEHDVGVSTVNSYHVKKVDADYFTEE